MKKILIFLFLFQTHMLFAQILSNDTVACNFYQDTLYALGSDLSPMQADDAHDTVAAIGFPFTFYGNVYNYLVISGNGYVTFDLTQATLYSPWAINAAIPNPGILPENAIMSPWHDINTGIGGQVYFGMSGIAPNRFFIITFCQVPMFSCTSDLATQQIILYEGSNKIEMFIEDKPLCLTWNGGAAVQGLVDATSTNADIVTDPTTGFPRNFPLPWTATNEGWEFIPNGTTGYTINQIAYVPIDIGINYWLNSLGDTIGIGPTLAVDILTTSTFHSAVMGNCYTSLTQDSITITINNLVVDLGVDYNIPCKSTTIIDPFPSGGTYPYTYSWNTGSTDTLIDVGGGIYILDVTDNFGCIASDTIEIFEDPSPSFDFGLDYNIPCNTTTLLDPVVTDGTQPYSYNWNNGSTDSSFAAADGFYILIVTDVYGCMDTDTITITEDVPPTTTISGGGSVCNDGTTTNIYFDFTGLYPWDLWYTDGVDSFVVNSISTPQYVLPSKTQGEYTILLAEDVNDCISDRAGQVTVIVNPLPVAVIVPNEITIYEGEEIQLDAGEYTYYQWYTIDDSLVSIEQILTVTDSGRFYIIVEDDQGCTDISAYSIVHTVPQTVLFIPSIFTPNNDDHNEIFVIKGKNIVTYHLQIYNRWGALLFESDTMEKGWDGMYKNKKIQEGSYYYSIEVLGEDGEVFNKTGKIQVIY